MVNNILQRLFSKVLLIYFLGHIFSCMLLWLTFTFSIALIKVYILIVVQFFDYMKSKKHHFLSRFYALLKEVEVKTTGRIWLFGISLSVKIAVFETVLYIEILPGSIDFIFCSFISRWILPTLKKYFVV